MDYQTYQPSQELASLVKCYWTLEVPAGFEAPRQRIVPDGCIEMAFILADDIRRYTTGEEFILQPRAMVLGQITTPFFIQPVGEVKTFAIRFYPFGFANFIPGPLSELADKETPLAALFGEALAGEFHTKIVQAADIKERIQVSEEILLRMMTSGAKVDEIVRSTVDALVRSKGGDNIKKMVNGDSAKRRMLERKFGKGVGISPKQLARIIRLQAALKILLNEEKTEYSRLAYDIEYYDQAHFINDFKQFTGSTPTAFLEDQQMLLSSLIYKAD